MWWIIRYAFRNVPSPKHPGGGWEVNQESLIMQTCITSSRQEYFARMHKIFNVQADNEKFQKSVIIKGTRKNSIICRVTTPSQGWKRINQCIKQQLTRVSNSWKWSGLRARTRASCTEKLWKRCSLAWQEGSRSQGRDAYTEVIKIKNF